MAVLQQSDGGAHPLSGSLVTIGRDEVNDVVLSSDKRVSRTHAELRFEDGRWMVVDLHSRNGVLVNGRRIDEHPLVDRDRLRLGDTEFVFVAEDDPNATEVADEAVRSSVAALSRREREVIALVAEGLTDLEIGERLHINVSTVRSHLDRISDKTGLRRRPELTRMAVDLGLVR